MVYYNPNVGGGSRYPLGGLQDENHFHNNTNMFFAFYSYYIEFKVFQRLYNGPITQTECKRRSEYPAVLY